MSHETNHREDDKSSKYTGSAVCASHNNGIPECTKRKKKRKECDQTFFFPFFVPRRRLQDLKCDTCNACSYMRHRTLLSNISKHNRSDSAICWQKEKLWRRSFYFSGLKHSRVAVKNGIYCWHFYQTYRHYLMHLWWRFKFVWQKHSLPFECLPVAVIVELIVGRERNEASPRSRQRKEDLSGCVFPHLKKKSRRGVLVKETGKCFWRPKHCPWC